MASVIKLDPITRLEGHMKIEVEIENNKVVQAKCTGNMFRGFENLLKGRDPRDAVHITQRICGLCPVSHGVASSLAIENSVGYSVGKQARLLRNLIQGGNYLADHILHFYHLSLLDYVKGPDKSLWSTTYDVDLRLSRKYNKQIFNNYIKALDIRRKAHQMVTIFSGKIPHVMSIMPGGVTKEPTREEINEYRTLLGEIKSFIDNEYYNDVQIIASVYKDYFNIGKGYGNFITYGVFPIEDIKDGKKLFRAGRYINGKYYSVDINKVTEDSTFSYLEGTGNIGFKNSDIRVNIQKKNAYSWIRAPRYANEPYEAGPLARMWINGEYRKGISVMDRHIARMLESKKIAQALSIWIDEIIPGEVDYAHSLHTLVSGEGIGLTEAPRGALLHYIKYSNARIDNYQIITPTCWNASPTDANGILGPIEKALIGVEVKDSKNPIELIRVVHSFDPCTACAVHVINPTKNISKDFIVQTPNPSGVL